MNRLRIDCVVGARPNFIKMAAIIDELTRRRLFDYRLIHTGQHFSPEMSQSFFDELGLPQPHVNLGIKGGTQSEQTAEIMCGLENVFAHDRPHIVLVVGDVNSTLAAALVAAKMGIAIAHVEAGLRSFDRRMPEEINRLVTDVVSDYLFVSEPSGASNLRAEGIPDDKIFFVGNVMIDTLLRFRERAAQSDILERLKIQPKSYAAATLHRPSNVDSPARLQGLVEVLTRLSDRLPVVFSVHPRTQRVMEQAGLAASGLILVPPLGYLDFLRLMSQARFVLTDSGGIQEETTILQVPCLTVRKNTERPITVEQGTNRLVGVEPENVLQAASTVLEEAPPQARIPELWDGKASSRILDILQDELVQASSV